MSTLDTQGPESESERPEGSPSSRVARKLLERRRQPPAGQDELSATQPQAPETSPPPASQTPASELGDQAGGAGPVAIANRDLVEDRAAKNRLPPSRAEGASDATTALPGAKVRGRQLVRLIESQDVDAEVEAVLGGFDEQSLLARTAPTQHPAPESGGEAQKRTVRVLSVRGSDVFVDLGERSEGVVPIFQFGDRVPAAGDRIELIVDHYDGANALFIMRRPGTAQEADWGSVQKGMLVDAHIKKVNKGGLEITVNGIRGFLPAGQVDLEHIEDFSGLVGQTLLCQVTEVSLSSRNLVVSRKAVLLREREERGRATLESIAVGKVYDGVVRRLLDFGAFVDIGGVDGLVHISQMSWQRVSHPSEILSPGQKVRVVVLSYEPESRKIGLGLRQLTESPWTAAEAKYRPGTIVRGRVTRLAEFGAFVQLEPAIEGLVHISELSRTRVQRVSAVVGEGQEVDVKVLSFDREQQRIGLSLKEAQPEPEEAAEPPEAAPAQPPRPGKPSAPLKGGLGTRTAGPLFE